MKKIYLVLVYFSLIVTTNLNAQNITTYAGDGTTGFNGDGGPATSAQFTWINGIAFDALGNLYICDKYKVRRISTSGIITTIAGQTTASHSGDGGLATAAGFIDAGSIAIDTVSGNIYIIEWWGSTCYIRLINAVGIINTMATGGPYLVACDTGGYLLGSGTCVIMRFAPNGTRTIFAGDQNNCGYGGDGGPASAALMDNPFDLAVDQYRNIYIADSDNNRIRKINTAGIITTIAGTGTAGYSGDGGSATAALLDQPAWITVDLDGNVYFTEKYKNRIRKISSAGIITTIAGNGIAGYSGDGGLAIDAEINFPKSLAVDKYGALYFNDWGNKRIRKIDNLLTTNQQPALANFKVSVYPNPNNGMFTIQLPANNKQLVSISITTILGEQIQNFKPSSFSNFEIDLSKQPKGVYYVKLQSATNLVVKKVVVQ